MRTETDLTPPSGQMKLPDPKSFKATVDNHQAAKIGRVEGLDYDRWAVATIDLQADPQRVASTRARLAAKGYQRVEGQPIVPGFTMPEVWVLPRELHAKRLEARHARIQKAYEDGSMTEAVLDRGVTNRAK